MRTITHIVLHCTATIEGRDHTIVDVAAWHKKRGFKEVGYHYLVKLDGAVEKGRAEEKIGAHVQSYNAKSIGVCYVGGLGRDTKAKDTRTAKQKASLSTLLKDLRSRYPKAAIVGHCDLSPDLDKDGVVEKHEWMKMCPSFDAKTEYKNL